MATITTAAAGNWSNTATWVGGVLPVATDDVQQDHALTVDGTYTCTNFVQATSGPLLTIPDTSELIFRGYINPRNSGGKKDVVVMAAGSTLTFDAGNQSGANAGKIFGLDSFTHGVFAANGTLAKPVTIRQIGTGVNKLLFDFNDALGKAGSIWPRFTYVTFETPGVGNSNFMYQSIGYGSTGNAEVVFDNCVLNAGCGRIQLVSDANASSATNGVFRLLNMVHNGGNGTESVNIGGKATGAATALIQGGFYKQRFVMYGGENWTVDGSVWWASQTGINNSGATKTALFTGLVRRAVVNDVHICLGDETDVYNVIDITGVGNNPHPIVLNGAFSMDVIRGVVDDRISGDIYGDMYAIPSTLAAHTYSVNGVVMLPTDAGKSPGKLVSMLGDAGVTISANHNTYISDRTSNTETGMGFGETYNGHVGMWSSVKSNLAFAYTAAKALIISGQANNSKVSNMALPTSVTHNYTWNGMTGTNSGVIGIHDEATAPANALFTGGTPNASGGTVAANPFVDDTRNIATWAGSLGGTATVAGAGDILRRAFDWTDGAYNPATDRKPAALYAWVRDGFKVTDPALDSVGHDGATIGAMAYVAGAAVPTVTGPSSAYDGQAIALTVTNADLGVRSVEVRQGAVVIAQTETAGGTNSTINLTLLAERVDPLTSVRRGTTFTVRVTNTGNSLYGEHTLTLTNPVNQVLINPVTINVSSPALLTSSPAWTTADQIQARGPSGGALPSGFTLYADGTHGALTAGNFEYRIYDAVTLTLGAWALATVTVGVIPSIITQPTNQTVADGALATFTVSASGAPTLTYQWYDGLVPIVGATSATYNRTVVAGDNGKTFTVEITNDYGQVTSSSVGLTVTAAGTQPNITTQPVAASVTAGDTATFFVVASGVPSVTYQWQKNTVNIAGATASVYTTPATVLGDNGSVFRCVVSNLFGQAISNTALLLVSVTSDTIAPSVPQNVTARFTAPAEVSMTWDASTDSGGSGMAGYRIYRNGLMIGSTSDTTYVDTTVVVAGTYLYQVTAIDLAGNESIYSPQITPTQYVAPEGPHRRHRFRWRWHRRP